MREELVQMFAATNLLTEPEREFVLAKLPLSAYGQALNLLAWYNDPHFQTVIRAHDELTLVVSAELWERIAWELSAIEVDQHWRLITLDVTIPLDVFGYMEQVARICAACEASLVVQSGYSTDHLFIKAERYHDVVHSLDDFIKRCRQGAAPA